MEGFSATFDVDLLPRHAWDASRIPTGVIDQVRIPGFPSFTGDAPGCLATVLEADAERVLRCRKEDMPCAGTEITIRFGPANAAGWPTRITIEQTGFGALLTTHREVFETHWRQIVADFRLYLERGITVPGTKWGPDLGATTTQTEVGLELTAVVDGGFAGRCGMQPGDLLLTLAGIRIHDTAQLWTVLALTTPGAQTPVTWARGRELASATISL